MDDLKTETLQAAAVTYAIYRVKGQPPMSISGSLTAEVAANGALIINSGGAPYMIFSAGQWLSVNVAPV